MICELIFVQIVNPNKINDNVNNDELDPDLPDKGMDLDHQDFKYLEDFEDNERNIVNSHNQIEQKHQEIIIEKHNYSHKINDFNEEYQPTYSLFDEPQEEQEILEDQQNWRITKTNQDKYRVFQKNLKKKTEYFD